MKDLQQKLYESEKKLCKTEAVLNYNLIRFGDDLAEREGYREHKGLDALHFYLIQQHHWLPSQVKSLNHDDLRFLLAEEMHGWTLLVETLD